MSRISLLAAAIALPVSVIASPLLGAAPLEYLSLTTQSEGLPKEFENHFFDVPLAVHIRVDRKFLGEAMVLLSKDERITLIELTDISDSNISSNEINEWQLALERGITLGPCQQQCANGLIAARYSLENSELSLLTNNAEQHVTLNNYHQQPEDGSTGLMLLSQANVAGGQQRDSYGRIALGGLTSLGNWTQTFNGQVSKNDNPEQDRYVQLHELHTQKEWHEQFVRIGYFTPDSDGLSRRIRTFGSHPETALGLMLGSSDSLSKDGPLPAMYPIYVSASRNATVEIYQNGALINSQQVEAGLQTLDTRPLPGGIYDVEVRLVEDGLTTYSSNELVYKPNNWKKPNGRWRYNAFAGRDTTIGSGKSRSDGALSAGISANYLLHPKAVTGISVRTVDEQNQFGASLDLSLGQRSSAYANIYQTPGHGTGTDIQAMHGYDNGTLILSHNRSWLDTRNTWEVLPDGRRKRQRQSYNGKVSSTSLGISHRLGHHNSLNARATYSEGQNRGTGMDVGWLRTSQLFGNDASWRLAAFERPDSTRKDRGVDLSLNLALGGPGKRLTASAGTRNSRDGTSDRNASIGYQQQFESGSIRQFNAALDTDTDGVGLHGSAQFETAFSHGDVMAQRSAYDQKLSGNLNMDSTLVVGARTVALSGHRMSSDASMIVDLESDIDDIELRVDDLSGHSAALRPGRNIVPVSAYQRGMVHFDFQDANAPAATIQPARASYHLNKGGVAYQQVRLMKTLTVFGRLIDEQRRPLRAAHVLNHASRGVTEADGFFSIEVSARTPTLEVVRGDTTLCHLVLDLQSLTREGDVLMAGDLPCIQSIGMDENAAPKAL